MSATTKNYAVLQGMLREITALEGISGLLGWDEMVMLPSGSSDCRGAQKEALAGVLHDKKTAPALGELLRSFEGDASALSPVGQANVRIAAKAYRRETALPKELVQKIAALETSGYNAWIAAREASDFSLFQATLQQWVQVNSQKAALVEPAVPAYDALLDEVCLLRCLCANLFPYV